MIPECLTKNIFNERDRGLLIRAYKNIMANVTLVEGLPWSPYRGITSGRNGCFTGIWNWDTAFHVMYVSRWNSVLVMEALSAFMQYQRADGMFADVVLFNGTVEQISFKPPVVATYVLLTYERGAIRNF